MKHVELRDFIQHALVEIATGIRNANKELIDGPEKSQYEVFNLRHNRGDSSKVPGIKFDVAVTADSKQTDKAGFFVALANIGGAAGTEKSRGDELAHRIQFEVGVASDWS